MNTHKQKHIIIKFLLSFTVCINFFVNAMAATKQIEKAWLGIATAKVDEVLAAQLDLPDGVGATVKLVLPDSPAAKSGINKHDVIFAEFVDPIEEDLFEFRANWQKPIFVFDELERRKINYDQILLIDSNIMIKWDCPNLFDLTKGKFTAARDVDNMRWTWESVQGYKKLFNDFNFDFDKYFNSGFIFFNESHKEIFQSFKQFYYDNRKECNNLSMNVVKRGFEQTCMNYHLQIHDVDLNLDIPVSYRMSHMHRTGLFDLDIDGIPFFIKHGR